MKDETSPEEYWAGIAEEVGEPVRAYALARLKDTAGPERSGMFAPRPVWGLVFITDSTLYIEPGSSSSWLQRVITSRPTPQAQERIAIPIDSMTKVDIPPPKTGLRRILAAPETEIEIHHEGSPGVLCIVLDWRGANDKLLIEILAELAPGS